MAELKLVLSGPVISEKLHSGDYCEVVCGGKVIWKTGDPLPTDAELELLVRRTRN